MTSLSDKAGTPARWDLFCRVIDNLGDAAVAWRLARQLAREHGVAVRLWIDAPQTLSRLVPAARVARTHEGVRIEHWLESAAPLKSIGPAAVADVVIACFGCELPPSYRVAMRARRPVWVNLEYLSAEDWVDSHHGLASPKSDGLTEWFFFPGFRLGTGGLLRESDLIEQRDAFRSDPWARTAFLSKLGITARPTDRFSSLFCYPDSAITELAQALQADQARGHWRLLLPQGVAPELSLTPGIERIPFVSQSDYDLLLWSCELNWVRGEDSWVRALWSGRPLVWQAYRQADGAHQAKLDAWLAHWSADAGLDEPSTQALSAVHAVWNALKPDPAVVCSAIAGLLESLPALAGGASRWTQQHTSQADLATQLVGFVSGKL